MRKLWIVLLLLVCSLVLFASVKRVETLENVSDFAVTPKIIEEYASISFTCNTGVHLTIEILNFEGKLVTTITSRVFLPGDYNLQWDRNDSSGSNLESGEYVIQVKEDKRFVTKRKTLILK